MAGLEGKSLDRYELRKLVGRGGMADVYEAYDPHFERIVAVKVFKREDEQMLRRFIREAHLMATLHNPHLVPIYDAGSTQTGDDPRYYIVMPFMEGGTLRARIRRSPLSLQETCRDIRDIADALDYIHKQGVIHRDIKASNVLLNTEGECYLTDFGIARAETDTMQLTSTGNVLGTVDYIAPELFESHRRADARSDLYSLGVLLFEMVTGQLPFVAENQLAVVTMHMNKRPPSPRTLAPHVSSQVERVILKALEKKPEQRYVSATALADAFCQAVAAGNKNGKAGIVDIVDPEKTQATVLPVVGANPKLVLPPVVPGISRPINAPDTPQSPHSRSAPLANAAETQNMPSRIVKTPSASGIHRTTPVPPSRLSRPSPRPPQRRRRMNGRRWVVAILALLALLAVTIPSIYAITHARPTPPTHDDSASSAQAQQRSGTPQGSTPSPATTPNLTATAQAAANATSTAIARATAVAIANVTATAQAHASATAGVILTATSGTPLYADALNNPGSPNTAAANWDGLNGNDSHCVFASDGYHVIQKPSTFNIHDCHESANQYANATIAVDVTMLKGHSGGLFFRNTFDAFNQYSGYMFEIDSNGNYKISVFGGAVLQNWTPSSALKTGYNVKNTLQVIMHGNTFIFYANDQFLTTLTDNTYASGEIGVIATSQFSTTEVIYSNVKVYSIR